MFGHHDHHRHCRSGGHFAVRGGRHWGPFSVEWEVAPGRHRGGGRRRFDGDELRLILLKLIAETPRHGYDLIREIEQRTGGAYAPSPGVVYPTLTLLDEMGLAEARASDGNKRIFAITGEGEAHLAERSEQVDTLMARLSDMGDAQARDERMPVRRAMHNLKSAVIGRVGGGVDEEQLNAIIDILDDAARRIERL
jgi:DNA-binding PadR family transcriptional regulator